MPCKNLIYDTLSHEYKSLLSLMCDTNNIKVASLAGVDGRIWGAIFSHGYFKNTNKKKEKGNKGKYYCIKIKSKHSSNETNK